MKCTMQALNEVKKRNAMGGSEAGRIGGYRRTAMGASMSRAKVDDKLWHSQRLRKKKKKKGVVVVPLA